MYIYAYIKGKQMKQIVEYLLSKKNNKANFESFKLKVWDNYKFEKYISSEDIAKFVLMALEKSKVNPKDIQEEFGYYKDPDDLLDAYDRRETSAYCRFEETLGNLLANDNKYSGKEGDILEGVFTVCYDIMGEVEKYLENNETTF